MNNAMLNDISRIKNINDILNFKISVKYLLFIAVIASISVFCFYFIFVGDIQKGIEHLRFILEYIFKNIFLKKIHDLT